MTNLSIKLYGFITGLLHREEGQDLVEYAVLVGFIGIAAAIAFVALGSDFLDNFVSAIGNCLDIPADPYVCP